MTKPQLQALKLSAIVAMVVTVIIGIMTYAIVPIVSHPQVQHSGLFWMFESLDFRGYVGFLWDNALVEGATFLLILSAMYIVLPQDRR
jgi:hypothetical protein